MKWLVLAVALIITSSTTAESQEEILEMPVSSLCRSVDSAREWLRSQGEVPFVRADGVVRSARTLDFVQVPVTVWVNPETLTMTIVFEMVQDGLTCMLAMGDDFAPAYDGDGI